MSEVLGLRLVEEVMGDGSENTDGRLLTVVVEGQTGERVA